MENELLKVIELEIKMDSELNSVIATIDIVRHYFNNTEENDFDDEDVIYALNEIENIIGHISALIEKLALEYEKIYLK